MANHLSFDVLSKLIKAQVSALEEPKARRHLASCGRCRSELEWLQRIHSRPGKAVGSEMGWPEMSGADYQLAD